MTRSADLIDEVHILRREHEKLELEKRIAELKAEPTIDEGCVGCCKVVDVAARLQEELEDTETKLVGCRNLIDDRDRIIREMDVTISDLMDNDKKINGFLDEYRVTVDNRDKTIKELKYRNIVDLHELYDLDKAERNKLASTIKDLNLELTKKRAIIEDLNAQLTERRNRINTLHGLIKDVDAELSARKEDSEVLMKVVDAIRELQNLTGMVTTYDMRHIRDMVKDYLDAPEGPPETPIDEKVCVFCGCKNPSIQVGVDWFCSMRCVDGQADVNKHIHDAGEPQEVTVTVAFLELP